jgi:nicotinate-nucleotide adenylyltransferase
VIGILGGSFDPIHKGHLVIAREAMLSAGLSRLLFMPVNIQPFKRDQQMTDASHRLAMLRLAVEDESAFGLTDIEIRKTGVSYTIDSLRGLREELPEGSRIYFILGADMLFMLEKWHKAEELLKEFAFIIGYRVENGSVIKDGSGIGSSNRQKDVRITSADLETPGDRTLKGHILEETNRLRDIYGTEFICMENWPVNISSSKIRERVKSGEDISGLVPGAVHEYILDHNLYR